MSYLCNDRNVEMRQYAFALMADQMTEVPKRFKP